MKRIVSVVLLAIAAFTLALSSSVLSADVAAGAKIFSANCAACHPGGGNAVKPDKPLKKDVLTQNGMYSPEAIIAQVTNGKNTMPSFKGRLKPQQIEDVAAYVLDQAEKGWPK